MTLEINTTRGLAANTEAPFFYISRVIQRYADTKLLADTIEVPDLRLQDTKNRQNSIDGVPADQKSFLQGRIHQYFIEGMDLYNELLREGIAKECARFVLPLPRPQEFS